MYGAGYSVVIAGLLLGMVYMAGMGRILEKSI